MQLNFSALAYESPFDRDIVEACVKEVMQALARSVAAKKNVEFTFAGIGRLQIRDSKVKMKFYKEFINSMDGSGRLVEALKDVSMTVLSCSLKRITDLYVVADGLVRSEVDFHTFKALHFFSHWDLNSLKSNLKLTLET